TLYTLDLETGQFLDFGEGNWPVWSPAGDQLLFQRYGDLWLGELASGATQLILPQTALNGNLLSYLVWLTDEMVAFTPRQGAQWVPEIWLMALAQPDLKTKIAAELYPMYMLSVDPSGPELYFLSDLGSLFPHHLSNIWKVSSTTGSLQQITAGFNIYKYHLYPETHTLLFSGFQAFARPDEAYDMDLWLLDLETDDLYRLTNGLDRGHLLGWYPAGRNFILHDTTDATLWALAENFTLRPLANGRSFQDDRRDAKFAITGLR
ncbi:MAG: hypothetical protein KDE28_09985, partial [Anaerolineales bacterium]|nr:hypothetical protein [Anaerolineales bacterium]